MAEDALRNIFRVLGTVAVLAAVYFFLVKPVLDTTNETFDRAFGTSESITQQVFDGLEDAGINNDKIRGLDIDAGDVRDADIDPESFGALTPKEAEKIFACMDEAGSDTAALAGCGRLSQELSSN